MGNEGFLGSMYFQICLKEIPNATTFWWHKWLHPLFYMLILNPKLKHKFEWLIFFSLSSDISLLFFILPMMHVG